MGNLRVPTYDMLTRICPSGDIGFNYLIETHQELFMCDNYELFEHHANKKGRMHVPCAGALRGSRKFKCDSCIRDLIYSHVHLLHHRQYDIALRILDKCVRYQDRPMGSLPNYNAKSFGPCKFSRKLLRRSDHWPEIQKCVLDFVATCPEGSVTNYLRTEFA